MILQRMKTKILIILLVLTGLVFGFGYWFQFVRPEDFCSKFSKEEAQGEITCQEARDFALEKYPGKVLNIEKTNAQIPKGKPPGGIWLEEQKAWLLEITLDQPLESPYGDIKELNIVVGLTEKKILNTFTVEKEQTK